MLQRRSFQYLSSFSQIFSFSNYKFGSIIPERTLSKVKGNLLKSKILNLSSTPSWSPSYPLGPYFFKNREYFIVEYEAKIEDLKRVIPEPLEPKSNRVLYEWIGMPDSSGFGCYQESGTVVPCLYNGEEVNYTVQMFLDDEPPIACGREIWGFPKKYGNPSLHVERDTLVGTLHYAGQQVAMGTMTFKHKQLNNDNVVKALSKTSCNLRIIPRPDGSGLERAQLVAYNLENIKVLSAYEGDARLSLLPFVTAPAADIPVQKIIGGKHILADLTLPHGRVLYDYLQDDTINSNYINPNTKSFTKEKVLQCSSMPAIAPSYPHQDYTSIERNMLYIHCKTSIEFLQSLIPYPIDLDKLNPDIFFCYNHTLGTGIGEYNSFKVLIPCTMNGIKCMFNALTVTDNSSTITCGRERIGQPQKFGHSNLEVNKDTIIGSLKYGNHNIATSSMVFNAEKLSVKETKELIELPELNLRVLPDVTGNVDIAQLVLFRYGSKQISEGWKGKARIHTVPHVNAPIADVPILDCYSGYHIKVNHDILGHSEILYDFKAASSD